LSDLCLCFSFGKDGSSLARRAKKYWRESGKVIGKELDGLMNPRQQFSDEEMRKEIARRAEEAKK
jgi:hypothetical protein